MLKVPELFCCHYTDCRYKTTKRKLFLLHTKRTHPAVQGDLYPCDLCDKSYHSSASLKKHKDTLHGLKKADIFQCDVANCDFTSAFQSDLERHKAKHVTEKSIFCQNCDFCCKRKSELTRHYRLKHTDAPPQQCDLCSYQTKNSSHMKRHRKLVHVKSGEEVATFFNVDPANVLIVPLGGVEEQVVL